MKSFLSPIESFKAIRFAALKKEHATIYNIQTPELKLPVPSKEAYLDYISEVAKQCTEIIAREFQKHDVAIEVIKDYDIRVQEQYSKMTWAEKADTTPPASSSSEEPPKAKQRKNVTWQETV
ncbi:MAG: hypothetical protein HON23_02450 [Rickettsiales bacterium]|jgi:hypothetical protein|nr:hypothetical protein [Rickettsiales bacterium]